MLRSHARIARGKNGPEAGRTRRVSGDEHRKDGKNVMSYLSLVPFEGVDVFDRLKVPHSHDVVRPGRCNQGEVVAKIAAARLTPVGLCDGAHQGAARPRSRHTWL